MAIGRVDGRDIIASAGAFGQVRTGTPPPAGRSVTRDCTTGGAVRAVAIGRIGGRDVIVSAGDDQAIRIWNPPNTGSMQRGRLAGHSEFVNCMTTGRLGNRDVIVSGSREGSVRTWDPLTGRPIGHLPGLPTKARGATALAAGNADGRDIIVVPRGSSLSVWDTATGQPVGLPFDTEDRPLQAYPEELSAVAVGRVGEIAERYRVRRRLRHRADMGSSNAPTSARTAENRIQGVFAGDRADRRPSQHHRRGHGVRRRHRLGHGAGISGRPFRGGPRPRDRAHPRHRRQSSRAATTPASASGTRFTTDRSASSPATPAR